MPTDFVWHPVLAALDCAAEQGRTIDIWLRDDDAVAPTPALERLGELCRTHNMPVLLAVIPGLATDALAAHVARIPLFTPTQHGFRHFNHAGPGERARELGGCRPPSEVLDELRRGRERMQDLFGGRAGDILVPPWNRIDDTVPPMLPALGFVALSTFGPPLAAVPHLAILNADLDIIDWRNGRVGQAHDKLAMKLVSLIEQRSKDPGPIGLLAHHLVHDETAWAFLDACLTKLSGHPAARFGAATSLIARDGAAD